MNDANEPGQPPLAIDPTVTSIDVPVPTVALAIGAHPGFPDLLGFGRRTMVCSLDEIDSYLTYQVGALHEAGVDAAVGAGGGGG